MSTIALITAAEARLQIPSLSGTGEDTNLDTVIEIASAAISRYCLFPELGGDSPDIGNRTYTHYLDGPTLENIRKLLLRVRPVVSITSIEDDATWAFDGSSFLVASGDYTLIKETGEVWLDPDASHSWSSGPRHIKVVYVAGVGAATANIPPLVKQAARITTRYFWDHPGMQGRISVSRAGATSSKSTTIPIEIPQEAKELLSQYRLIEASLG